MGSKLLPTVAEAADAGTVSLKEKPDVSWACAGEGEVGRGAHVMWRLRSSCFSVTCA